MIRHVVSGLLAGSALVPLHPLGNFTVNRYDGLVAAPHELRIDHVQDLAEIPAAQVLEGRPDLRGRGDGAGLQSWAARSCATASQVFQITAAGDRMTISRASVPAASRSARLTVYPKDMLSSPLDQRSASFTVTPGGPALAAPAAPGGPAGELPRGVDRLTQSFTDLVARRHLTTGFALVALLIAVALGAVHALAPGHGKTIMAAQAVSRGRRGLRDILTLGLTVTVTHTLGVLVLGLLVAVPRS